MSGLQRKIATEQARSYLSIDASPIKLMPRPIQPGQLSKRMRQSNLVFGDCERDKSDLCHLHGHPMLTTAFYITATFRTREPIERYLSSSKLGRLIGIEGLVEVRSLWCGAMIKLGLELKFLYVAITQARVHLTMIEPSSDAPQAFIQLMNEVSADLLINIVISNSSDIHEQIKALTTHKLNDSEK